MLLFAHGIVGRADLPIPETLFARRRGRRARRVLRRARARLVASRGSQALPRAARCSGIPRAVEVVLGALGVAVFFVAVYAGLFGTDAQSQNLAPTAVYVGFWVGVPFLSLLFGDVFRLFSPWRALGRADRLGRGPLRAASAAGAARVPRAARPAARPRRGLFAFAICELCWARGTRARAAGGADARLPRRACSSG